MKLAIMQPYFLPYIGYFQLMAASDRFVVFDDVNYIKRGWINRNRILLNRKDHLFTIPLNGASQNRQINTIALCSATPWRVKLRRTVEQAYRAAPYFEQIFPLIARIIESRESDLAGYIGNSLRTLHAFLDMRGELIPSSSRYANEMLKGQERILDICRQERASDYLNLPGGQDLYQDAAFSEKGFCLKFVQSRLTPYKQFDNPFVPGLSIIDVLMFNGRDQTVAMLNEATVQ